MLSNAVRHSEINPIVIFNTDETDSIKIGHSNSVLLPMRLGKK